MIQELWVATLRLSTTSNVGAKRHRRRMALAILELVAAKTANPLRCRSKVWLPIWVPARRNARAWTIVDSSNMVGRRAGGAQ